MDLTPYLTSVADDLARASALADDHTREVAGRVATALEPALRLALMQALSDAAASITADLSTATVVVRLEGRDPVLSVHDVLDTDADDSPTETTSPMPDLDDDGDTARVTVRLPAALKSQAEALAAQADQSLNSWLVQTVRRAVVPTPAAPPTPPRSPSPTHTSRRVTGWA